jgi:hypothetical protein
VRVDEFLLWVIAETQLHTFSSRERRWKAQGDAAHADRSVLIGPGQTTSTTSCFRLWPVETYAVRKDLVALITIAFEAQ